MLQTRVYPPPLKQICLKGGLIPPLSLLPSNKYFKFAFPEGLTLYFPFQPYVVTSPKTKNLSTNL